MTPTRDFEDYDYMSGRPYLCIGTWEHNDTHRSSTYRHPLGVVEVDEYISGKPILAFGFNWQGRTYRRRWEHSFGDKTIARLAREFVEEITA
jgi:hypothetical protein